MITKTQSWPRIHAFYAQLLAEYRMPVEPMIRVLEWLEKEGVESELFAFTSMHDLVITDQSEFDWDHHTLRVSLDFSTGKLFFEYARHWASIDRMKKVTDPAEAIEVLRQFLAYKFGIHRPLEKRPNQPPEPTATSVTPPAAQESRQP